MAADKQLTRICMVFCKIMLCICACIIFADVVARYLADTSIMWAQQVATWSVIFMAFFGTGPLLIGGGHLAISFFRDKLPVKIRKFVDILNAVATLVFMIILLISGWEYTAYLLGRNAQRLLGTIQIPFWPIMLGTICAGTVIIIIYAIKQVAVTVKKEPGAE